jgi:hypothetical protein
MMEPREGISRSSIKGLVGALVLALPLYLYLLVFFALAAMDSSTGAVIFVFVASAAGWMILAWVIANFWRKGWASVWKIPLLVMVGVLFWPVLLLLFSRSIRRAVLPGRPFRGAAYCVSCGSSIPVEGRFCPSCGAAAGAHSVDRLASVAQDEREQSAQDVG